MLLCVHLKTLLVICWVIGSSEEAKRPRVKTKSGRLSGITKTSSNGKSITMFLGIPYAKAPVGPLRFLKPEKVKPWHGVREATEYGNTCNQLGGGVIGRIFTPVNAPQNEDCLFINVFIPGIFKKKLKIPKAVMVWIHGGGFVRGSSNLYRGEELAVSEDVIVISFNYRLGLFGFLASDDSTIPGNQGFFDQIMALKWVNENVEAFGGDVSKITIFGQSAGAIAVVYHILSPISVGLFSRAITLSSALPKFRTRQGQYESIKKAVIPICGEATNVSKVLKCLQGLSTNEIIALHFSAFQNGYLLVCRDGVFLTDDHQHLLSTGKFNKNVQVIVGYTDDDGDFTIPNLEWESFIREGIDITKAKKMITSNMAFFTLEKFNEDVANELIFEKYINCKTDPLDIARGVLNMGTDLLFGAAAFLVADELAKFGVEVYLYRFDHLTNYLYVNWQPNMDVKAGHLHDLIYIFGSGFNPDINDLFTEEEKLLATAIRTSFSNFANKREMLYPTKKQKLVHWKPYTSENKRFLVFATDMTQSSMKPVPEESLKTAKFWHTVVPQILGIHEC